MLHPMKDMEGYAIGATDGLIGNVKDFYFDDKMWVIRYLIVETGEWLSSRRVLVSPFAINQPKWSEKVLPAAITRDQVKNSPHIDTDKPVSRQHEMGYLGYYGYPYYWAGGGLWGGSLYPGLMLSGLGFGGTNSDYRSVQAQSARADVEAEAVRHEHDDPHLRSGSAISTYHVHASDGDIGHVQVDLTRQAVKDSPRYDSATLLSRAEETDIYNHYRRDGYWPREATHESARTAL